MTARSLEGRWKAVMDGISTGGRIPFGYRRPPRRGKRPEQLELEPAEAEVVRSVFDSYSRGRSLGQIERRLADDGVLSKRGKPWSKAALAWVLRNRTYLGYLRCGSVEALAKHPPVVSWDVFAKVQRLLREKTRLFGFRQKAGRRVEAA